MSRYEEGENENSDYYLKIHKKLEKKRRLGTGRNNKVTIILHRLTIWSILRTVYTLVARLPLRYDTIEGFNMDTKDEYSALSIAAHVAEKMWKKRN